MADSKFDKEGSRRSQQEQAAQPRRGLSPTETIAADANLSAGSRGVDTSGVMAGAGAGAGGTVVSPGLRGESPVPQIVSGARSTATTPRGIGTSDASKSQEASQDFSEEEIAARAYRCWQERGCPDGSPEIDWARAEEELKRERDTRSAAASAS
jgi:hypothetical protein